MLRAASKDGAWLHEDVGDVVGNLVDTSNFGTLEPGARRVCSTLLRPCRSRLHSQAGSGRRELNCRLQQTDAISVRGGATIVVPLESDLVHDLPECEP